MQTQNLIGSAHGRLKPNRVRYWKHRLAPNLQEAMAECTAYALEAHNRSIEQIADLTGVDNHWTLRKYITEVRLPLRLIRPFENACGIDLITRYLASSSRRIVIDIPHGTTPGEHDVQTLQRMLADATSALIAFYQGEKDPDETIHAVWTGMAELGWHRANVTKHHQPELPL